MDPPLSRIILEADKNGGRARMRIRVTDVPGMLASGDSAEEILEGFPYLEADDIRACLAYAANVTGDIGRPGLNFIVDAQLPQAAGAWLRSRGHDAVHLNELDMRTAADSAVWALGAGR